MTDPVDAAIAEARRREQISDRDISAEVEHFASSVRPVCSRWGLTVDRWLDGGAGRPTLAVTMPDGRRGVLKLEPPGSLDTAARVMAAADGHGYARLLLWDATRGALVTELLGEDLWQAERSLAGQVRVTVPLLLDAWQVPRPAGGRVEHKAEGLLRILGDLGPRYGAAHPEALALATAYAVGLARDEAAEVVCHGDPHGGNVLRRGERWAMVDPDGFVGERSYDLGVVVRDGCREVLAAEAEQAGAGVPLLWEGCRLAGGLGGVDPERVWRWGYVERVTTGLYLAWFGFRGEAATFLDTATLVARSSPRAE